jgi:hypothetical protein
VVFANQLHAGADPRRPGPVFVLWIAALVGGLLVVCAANGQTPH